MEGLFDLDKLINLRRELHQNPELSNSEFITAERIAKFLAPLKPDELIRGMGGNGIACIFKGKVEGSSILFRCDMDALPIEEDNIFDYASTEKGVFHACGHDGHMAIIAGLAEVFSKNPPEKGQVVLLFQPSEETGQGAYRMLSDEKFKKIKIDYVFALHNLPGFDKGSIVLRKGVFASASKGMIIKLFGETAHAGEPEKGNSPAIAMADVIKELNDLSQNNKGFNHFSLVTIIHARLGEVAFGTSPGYAEVMATLRTFADDDMEKLLRKAEDIAKHHAERCGLASEISYTEEFPVTANNDEMLEHVEETARSEKMNIKYIEQPFPWSEDFGHFTQSFPGALFGLGSGKEHPQLHSSAYDFPDEIIENGIKVFYGIYKQIAMK